MVSLSERLKTLRKVKGMTQEQLAEYMGISPQAVSRWETAALLPKPLRAFGARFESLPPPIKKPPVWAAFFGGEGGIRTLEMLLTPTRFPIVRPRPD